MLVRYSTLMMPIFVLSIFVTLYCYMRSDIKGIIFGLMTVGLGLWIVKFRDI